MVDIRHFFGLKNEPFPQDVPLKQLYQLPSLSPVETSVLFSVKSKAISIITGDVGSGKSTSLRYVCNKFHPSEYVVIPLVGGNYSTMELYRQILLHFGVLYQSYQISIMASKIRHQFTEIAAQKVTPILVIDEAHLLKRSVFAQLHTLAQFEYDSRPVLSMILCGQDYLIEHLSSS
jgi:general secretion pathway protein A